MKKAMLKVTPILAFNGQCNQAIELYTKAFGAEIVSKILYSEANSTDYQYKETEKDFVYFGEMMIGNHLISFGDDSGNILGDRAQDKSSATSLLIEFESEDELNAAYKVISDGATILTPLCSPTYCTAYVALKDKFGISWQLMSGYAISSTI